MKIRNNIAVSETGFVFDPNSGDSFTLNETGKQILTMLSEGKTEVEIKKYFIKNFDVDTTTFENNFSEFSMMLQSLNLIEE